MKTAYKLHEIMNRFEQRRTGKTMALVNDIKENGGVLCCLNHAEALRIREQHGIDTTYIHQMTNSYWSSVRILIDQDALVEFIYRTAVEVEGRNNEAIKYLRESGLDNGLNDSLADVIEKILER